MFIIEKLDTGFIVTSVTGPAELQIKQLLSAPAKVPAEVKRQAFQKKADAAAALRVELDAAVP